MLDSSFFTILLLSWIVFFSERHCLVSARYFFISSFKIATELLVLIASSSLFFIAEKSGTIISQTMSLTSDILTKSPYFTFILRVLVIVCCSLSFALSRYGFTPSEPRVCGSLIMVLETLNAVLSNFCNLLYNYYITAFYSELIVSQSLGENDY